MLENEKAKALDGKRVHENELETLAYYNKEEYEKFCEIISPQEPTLQEFEEFLFK